MTDLTGRKHRRKLEAEFEHICTTQARLLALVEHLVSEVQWLRNREDRIDGRVERLELTAEMLLDMAREVGLGVPRYPQTQAEIPMLEERRQRRQEALP